MKKFLYSLVILATLLSGTAYPDGLSTTPGQRLHQGGKIFPSLGGTGINTSTSTGVPSVTAGAWSVSTALPSGTTATTQSASDNSTKVATTAYVDAKTFSQGGYNAQSTTYAPVAGDVGKQVDFTGSSATTFTLTSASTLGSAWWAVISNGGTSSAVLTLKSSSGTIDGIAAASGFNMYPGEVRLVTSDGTNFHTKVLHGFEYKVTSSGSWMVPPGYKEFRNRVWASGQSGSSRTTTGNAGGGAGGSYVDITLDASKFVAAGSTETLTVAGTSAGVSGNTAGNAANSSSITINGTTFTVGTQLLANGYGTLPTTAASASLAGGGATQVPYANNLLPGGEGGGYGGDVTAANAPQTLNGAQSINAIHGGGGGGASSSTAGGTRTGGTSIYGGNGGAGGANTGGNGTNGTVPGGGGGAAVQGGTSGSGAAGQIIIIGEF